MKSKLNRIISMFLATIMLIAMVPTTTFAATTQPKIIQTGSGIEMVETLEYTFETDPELIGSWTTYDFIEKIPAKYDPNYAGRDVATTNKDYYLGCTVLPDGSAMQHHAGVTSLSE